MRLVAKDGEIIETLNKKELKKFKEATRWYEKASNKIAKKYHKGIGQEKEKRYAEAVALATEETRKIDERYKEVISGDCTVECFKEAVSDWFYKVKEGMDAIDAEAREAGEPFCDYED